MGQVLIDLFFPDAQGLGKFPGAHLFLTQEIDYPLANRPHWPDILLTSPYHVP
jgi:hypothetical protein